MRPLQAVGISRSTIHALYKEGETMAALRIGLPAEGKYIACPTVLATNVLPIIRPYVAFGLVAGRKATAGGLFPASPPVSPKAAS